MFLKTVNPEGTEALYECDRVYVIHDPVMVEGQPPLKDHVRFDVEDNSGSSNTITIKRGTGWQVYAMNCNGRTIDHYNLGGIARAA